MIDYKKLYNYNMIEACLSYKIDQNESF